MGAHVLDLTGQRFGRLVVLERYGSGPNGSALWLCQCDCGNLSIVLGSQLRGGRTKSCGCLRSISRLTHGQINTPLYKSWAHMKERCNNPNSKNYNDYGGRGITICDEWNDFIPFMEWALKNGYKEGLTIERNDVNGNYCPENCSWANRKEQANNRRSNIIITYFGETHTLMQWCEILNLPYILILERMRNYNWDFWRAISTPLPDHYYEDCYDYDYSNEYYEDPYEYDNYIYDE